MNRLIPIIVVGCCVLAIASSWAWCRSQMNRLAAREAIVVGIADDARQVLALRGLRERASLGERPRQDLIARVNEAMAAAGIARNALGGVTTETDGPTPGSGSNQSGTAAANSATSLRAQAMRVALKGVAPDRIGAFLEHWRRTQPLWTPTSIELSRAASKDPAVERFDASIVLSVFYVAPIERTPKS